MPIPRTSGASRKSSREEYPDCTLSLSCAVLPEYREYERAVTTLVDAFVKPHMERYLRRVHDELGAGLEDKPFLVMQSSGGVASAEQVVQQADHHRAVGPGGRRARQRRGRRDRGLSRRGDARRRRHLDRPLPDRSGQAARHQWRRGRRVPGAHSDDRHRDHRHRRRLDRLDQPRRPSQGRAAAAPAPSPGRCAIPNGGAEPTITDANLVLGRIPPALIGGGIALDAARSRAGPRRAGAAAARQHERRSSSPTASSRSPTGTRPTPSAR